MKYTFLLLLSLLGVTALSAQQVDDKKIVKDEIVSLPAKNAQGKSLYQIKIRETGIYDVEIVGPKGDRINQQVSQKKMASGAIIDIQIQQDKWSRGNYRILVYRDQMQTATYKIRME